MYKVIVGDGEHEREVNVEYKDVNYGGSSRPFVGDIEFDGHHTLWGFEYFPTTYLKSSGLSGDEYRKGGEIRYFRNRKQVFSEFCREPEVAALKIGQTLLKLRDFPWEVLVEGNKVYWRETPAIVSRIIWDQGCVILDSEEGNSFPDHAWVKENWEKLENKKSVKVEFFDDSIWWFRD